MHGRQAAVTQEKPRPGKKPRRGMRGEHDKRFQES